jgi:hypothetical protein
MVNKNTEINNAKADKPNQPVGLFLQEASNLYQWCLDDAEQLKSVGITLNRINELPIKTKACREAEAIWNSVRNTLQETQKQWRVLAPQAIKLRTELLKLMRFAFREKPGLLRTVSAITKGSGYADLIQDLNDIALLGKNNKELLVNIGFDIMELDTVSAKAKEIASLWANAKADQGTGYKLKIKRNKSFWQLHQLLTEIRIAGRFVFRNDKSRYIGYTSAFWKNKYNKRNKSGNSKTPNP